MKEPPTIPDFNNLYGIIIGAESVLGFTNQLKIEAGNVGKAHGRIMRLELLGPNQKLLKEEKKYQYKVQLTAIISKASVG